MPHHVNTPVGTLHYNYDLQPLNTMALPSVAQVFAQFETVGQLLSLLDLADQKGWGITVIGGGSNVLLAPYIPGLVIQSANTSVHGLRQSDDASYVRVGAGKNWHQWVCESPEYGHGLENLALIPGTVGAAPIQNIGAYGVEVDRVIDCVDGLHIRSRQLVRLDGAACRFGYRDSLFKRELAGDFVVLSVAFRLQKRFSPTLSYGPLARWAECIKATASSTLSSDALIDAVCSIRRQKLPDPDTLPNSGSFFKNPMIDQANLETLIQQHPDLPHYPAATPGQRKLAAGWLIEQCGWKGKPLGPVLMHKQQALVMTNPDEGTLADVFALQAVVQSAVLAQFGVALEAEPSVIGLL